MIAQNIKNHFKLVAGTVCMFAVFLAPVTVHAAGTGYAASDVLGQLTGGAPDFTTSTSGTSDTKMNYPAGIAIDAIHHRLFVGDVGGNRVLVYNLDTANNLSDHTADYVIGQANFTDQQSHTTRSGLNFPYVGLAYDATNNRLFASDTGNNRVLIFDVSNGITNGMNASYVLGQPDFTSSGIASTSQSSLYNPEGLAYDTATQRLFVVDSYNYRVLVYTVAPGSITNGMNASYVIGQPNFTTANSASSQNTLGAPVPVAYNTVTHMLFVGDDGGERILIFDLSGGITNGMNASHVLGQPNFTSSAQTQSPTQSTTMSNEALAIDTKRNILYQQDDSNNRITAFDLSGGITDNMNARLVIGQTDFSGSDFSCPTASATNLCDSEGGLAVDPANNRLYVTDSGYNRVLVYNFAHYTTPEGTVAGATLGKTYSFSMAAAGSQGTLAYSLIGGSLPPGLTLNAATGVISGMPTQVGTYSFELALTDDLGVLGSTYDDPGYSITVSAPAGVVGTNTSGLNVPGPPNTGLYTENNTKSLLILLTGVSMLSVSIKYYFRKYPSS